MVPMKETTREILKRKIVVKGETYDIIIQRILQVDLEKDYQQLLEQHQKLKDYCQQLESIIDPEILKEINSGD